MFEFVLKGVCGLITCVSCSSNSSTSTSCCLFSCRAACGHSLGPLGVREEGPAAAAADAADVVVATVADAVVVVDDDDDDDDADVAARDGAA